MELSIKDCVSFGWKTFKKRPWFFIGIMVIAMIVEAVSSVFDRLAENSPLGLNMLLFAISFLISALFAVGNTRLFLKAHDAPADARVTDLWYPRAFWRFIATSILLWLIIGLPFLALFLLSVPPVVYALLLIPALVIALVYGFAIYLVVDRGTNPIEALKESARITRGHRVRLFLLLLAGVGINILGLLALIVGLLVSIPVTVLSMVHAYRTLAGDLALATPEESPVTA